MVNFHCHTNSCSHRSSSHRHETQRVLRCAIPYRELTPDRQYCSSGKQKGLMTCPFYTHKLGILQGRGRAELHSDWSGEDPAPVSGPGRTLGHPRWGEGACGSPIPCRPQKLMTPITSTAVHRSMFLTASLLTPKLSFQEMRKHGIGRRAF